MFVDKAAAAWYNEDIHLSKRRYIIFMKTDILIFSGQSNMQGQTEALPFPNDPVSDALEYRLLTDSLVPLMHPVGETIAELLAK